MRLMINICAILLIATVTSFTAAAEDTVYVPIPENSISIGQFISYCQDNDGKFTIADILSGKCAFQKSQSRSLGFGYSDTTYWLRFTIRNNDAVNRALILDIDNPIVDRVELFLPGDRDQPSMTAGDHVRPSSWPVLHRNPLFPLDVPPGDSVYHLKVKSTSNLSLPAVVWTVKAFAGAERRESMILWLFYGIMIAMVVYHLFLLFSSRDMGYFFYIMAVTGFILFRLAYNGLAFIHLWPGSIWWANTSVPFFISFFVAFLVQFTRNFLQTRIRVPLGDRILIGLGAYFVGGAVFSLFGPYQVAIRAVLGMGAVTCLVFIVIGFFLLKKGVREAAFYLGGWGLFLVGSFLNILRDFGVAPVTFITTWGQQIGAVFQMMILSLGLADRINSMKAEISRTQRELHDRNISLEHERELLAVTLRSITDAVITVELDGIVLLMNRVAERLTGWKWDEAKGRHVRDIFTVVQEGSCTPVDFPYDNVMGEGTVAEADYGCVLVSKNGEGRHIAYSCAPIRDSASMIIGAVLVIRDITERLRIEKELLKTSKLETLSAFAGGIAHDFNNILTVITGNLSLVKAGISPDDFMREILDDTEKITLRAKDLTHQLLTFSKGGDPIKKRCDVRIILRETASFIASGSRVMLSFDLADDLWGADIDEGQVSQAVNNLVINAMQAMPRGGTITVGAHNLFLDSDAEMDSLPAGNYLLISVRDQGTGIDPETLPRIFEPFFTTKPEGNGIGLASTASIVRKHGGHISVQSEQGKGSEFMIYLPSTGSPFDGEAHHVPGLVSGVGRILVLDDEELVLKTASKMLMRLGYTVDTTQDGQEAVDRYQTALQSGEPFAAVIMDLTIPGRMGGLEALEKIRSLDPSIKAIVSSGYSNDPVMANYRDYGFSDIIVKPYTIESLSETVARVTGTAG